ncbi:MAG TPA: zf-HC2 domain-containing protein [Pyrinomonadaceae bacterium]|nr:zf-HC2 domain-containing protein [Pyrinomonadaceae bacterium]
MKLQTAQSNELCPREEIVAYIDGEVEPRREFELEMHFAVCASCSEELNAQKKLLCALDSVLLTEREVELPADFTKIVVAKAESNVSGLRRPQERRNALFICAAMFLPLLIWFGAETEAVLATFRNFGEQIFAVGGLVFHLIYDLAVGFAVISRSLSSQFVFNSIASVVFLLIIFIFSLITVSRLVIRFNRA